MNKDQFWIQTWDGGKFNFIEPDSMAVNVPEIATVLSRIQRFGGHLGVGYTVLQHCHFVAQLCPPQLAFWGLIHDAHEAYLGDIPTPLQWAIAYEGGGPVLERLKRRVDNAICERLGIDYITWYANISAIGEYDRLACAIEALLLFRHKPTWTYIGIEAITDYQRKCLLDIIATDESVLIDSWCDKIWDVVGIDG